MKITNDDFWEIIKYNYDQIQFAEIKSSVVVSVYSLLFTVAYTIDILDDENIYSFNFSSLTDYLTLLPVLPIAYFTVHSFVCCIRCFLPRIKHSSFKSPLFFGDIALNYKDFNQYKFDLKELVKNPEEYQEHLSHMVYVTGNIAFTKFKFVNQAIKSLIKSIAFFILFIGLIYLTK